MAGLVAFLVALRSRLWRLERGASRAGVPVAAPVNDDGDHTWPAAGPQRRANGKLRFEARAEDLQRAWSAIVHRVTVANGTYAAMFAPPRSRSRADRGLAT